jgi:2-succinyl-5-enolpyruvyl-6-hydroxy-3-cyclohexene-1-carboxylate synthase
VTAVLGDLAALHDLISLVLCKDLRAAFVLVVLNNDGGGIFSRLPINDGSKAFERFFTTPHGLTFEHAAKQFGLQYEYATEAKPFAAAFAECHSRGGASLIEYRTETVLDERKLDLLVEQGLANSLREGRSGSEPRAQVGHTVGH